MNWKWSNFDGVGQNERPLESKSFSSLSRCLLPYCDPVLYLLDVGVVSDSASSNSTAAIFLGTFYHKEMLNVLFLLCLTFYP